MRDLRRAIFAIGDLTNGAIGPEFVYELGVEEFKEWLEDALEWRKDVNAAKAKK